MELRDIHAFTRSTYNIVADRYHEMFRSELDEKQRFFFAGVSVRSLPTIPMTDSGLLVDKLRL